MFAIIICSLLVLGTSGDSSRKLVDCAPESANLFDDGVNCVNLLTILSSSQIETSYTNEAAKVTITFPEPQEFTLLDHLDAFELNPIFGFKNTVFVGSGDTWTFTLNYNYSPPVQIPLVKLFRYFKLQADQFFILQDLLPGFDEKYPFPEIKLEIEGPSVVNIDCPPSVLTYTVNLEDNMQDDESKYTWDVFGETVTDSLKAEVNAQSGLTMQVDSSNLVEGIYFFIVTVDSYYDEQFFDSITVEVKSVDSVVVTLTPEMPYIITSREDLDIEASIEIVCEDYDTSFIWEFISSSIPNRRLEFLSDPSDIITNSQEPSNVLDINAGNLEPGFSYRFTLTVEHGPISTSLDVEVLVDFSDPVVEIDLTDSVFFKFQDLVLDGSCSFDPDFPEEDDRLSFEWTCEQDGADCIGADDLPFDLTGEVESVLQISKDLLDEGAVYTFTLTATSLGLKTASKSVTVTIEEFVDQIDFVVNTDDNFSVYIEVEGQVESTELTQVLGPDIGEDRRRLEERELGYGRNSGTQKIRVDFTGENIPKGEYFGFQVDYVTDKGCGKHFFFFYTNTPPTCSGINVVPAGDEFTISIDGCADDDGPILFSLRVSRAGPGEVLLDDSENNSVTTELQAGSYDVRARVCDAFDLCIDIFDSFDVSRRMLRSNTQY